MKEKSSDGKKTIEAMLMKLREIGNRSKKALKKSEVSGQKEDKKFERELVAFHKKYGK